MRDAFFAYA